MALTEAQAALRAATPVYQRYKLNTITKVAHDVVYSDDGCDIDAAHALAFKPSVPPDFRFCTHCAANFIKADDDTTRDVGTRAMVTLRQPLSEAIAREQLAKPVDVTAAGKAAGLVGAESSRDPTRGDGGGTIQPAENWQHEAPAEPPSAPERFPRELIPFPLGGRSLAFTSPDSSNVERMTWLDGNAVYEDGGLGWQYQDGTPRLLVEFKGGDRYLYEDVGLGTWCDLYRADSVGQMFDEIVKKAGKTYRRLNVDELREAGNGKGKDESNDGDTRRAGSPEGAASDEARADAGGEQSSDAGADDGRGAANGGADGSAEQVQARAAGGRGRRNPTKGESELTKEQLAQRDYDERQRLAALQDDTLPEV